MSEIVTDAAGPQHEADLCALFDASSSPCFCRYWHFEGTNNDWLERCASNPNENRRELGVALREQSDEAKGVVAFIEGKLVGWTKVAPAVSVPKLYGRRLYKSLPCFDGDRTGVFVIGCFLVHPLFRRRGVAAALVEGAVRLAPSWGARALEAFPRRPREAVRDEELWTGSMGAFRASGFREVHDLEPYPVLRRDLRDVSGETHSPNEASRG